MLNGPRSRVGWAAAGAVGLAALPAGAAISFFDLLYTQFSEQDSPLPPSATGGTYRFDARIFAGLSTDAAAATLRINGGSARTFARSSPTSFEMSSVSYPSSAALFAAYPSGTYSYQISGGVLGTLTASINRAATRTWSAQVPALDPVNFIEVSTLFDVARDQELVFGAWTLGTGSTVGYTFIDIYGPADIPVSVILLNTDSTLTIPAGTLEPDTDYTLSIVFSSRLETANAGFGTATAVSSFDRATNVRFRTLRGGLCVADVDDGTGTGTRDGGVSIDDLLYYVLIFESGLVAADVDDGSGRGTPDGGVSIDDLLFYLVRFESGC
jgi:hypothetical protein